MKLYSTNNPQHEVSLKEAIFKGLPDDNGLYMPCKIDQLPQHFFDNITQYSFQEIAYTVARNFIYDEISDADLKLIVEKAINFPAPIVKIADNSFILELFHGPSLAFKDFGARFMAQLMSYYNSDEDKKLTILVATSGDTGGAVANGFLKTPNIDIIILYPSNKVSDLQEKQLTTLGNNITAVEIDGTFDDCQRLVKMAFLDTELTNAYRLSSANSINISRLIPQTFYYFEAYKQVLTSVDEKSPKVVFSIPSGNFGNLTAGLFAKKMGLPVYKFLAATNANDIVPQYLNTGIFSPRPSIPTLSNAMDVGNPSNFSRMMDLYSSTWNYIKNDIVGYAYSDEETKEAIREVYHNHSYTIDPHGAIGYLALKDFRAENIENDIEGVILETAHPAKFLDDMESILDHTIEIPQKLEELKHKEKTSSLLSNNFSDFKKWLLERI
ncbi:MAG: threonine synthase [Saprospiraceae bacterium]|nr:threonine synthase [Saprospiraceae bacterium]